MSADAGDPAQYGRFERERSAPFFDLLDLVEPCPAAGSWVKGTLLTDYRRRLPEGMYEDFVARCREEITAELPDVRPFPFTFKRVLLWGTLPSR